MHVPEERNCGKSFASESFTNKNPSKEKKGTGHKYTAAIYVYRASVANCGERLACLIAARARVRVAKTRHNNKTRFDRSSSLRSLLRRADSSRTSFYSFSRELSRFVVDQRARASCSVFVPPLLLLLFQFFVSFKFLYLSCSS